jgi:DNA (cytosine-5)-methyltransferase 1
MISVELFAGCGGFALGLARAGFEHRLVVEVDEHAQATLKKNKDAKVDHFRSWELYAGDVRNLNYSTITEEVALVAGGPPCQPFSIGGRHAGPEDARNMWPEAIRAVRALTPKAFLFENVRGLIRPSFGDYLKYIKECLAWPEFGQKPKEDWQDHARRLSWHVARCNRQPSYRVVCEAINTADYGAPQKRHRIIIMGVRADVASDWQFPQPTHSLDALAHAQYVTGEYWKAHSLPKSDQIGVLRRKAQVGRMSSKLSRIKGRPWVTVRDAIGDLATPTINTEPVSGHILHPGARTYPRHTGSRWDEPSKALKAGAHGVPGGENILAPVGGKVRYFTLREMARLQGFPDDFVIPSGWKVPIRQLGNAVPVSVGRSFGDAIRKIIGGAKTKAHVTA